MTWTMYYDEFYYLSESKQISEISALENFDNTDEIVEIAGAFCDEKPASKLILKALSLSTKFTASQIEELCDYIDEDALVQLLLAADITFTCEQLEYLADFVDESVLSRFINKDNVSFALAQDDNIFDNFQEDNLIEKTKLNALTANPTLITPNVLRNFMDCYFNGTVLDVIPEFVPLTTANQKIMADDYLAFNDNAMAILLERLSKANVEPNTTLFKSILNNLDENIVKSIYSSVKTIGNKKAVNMFNFKLKSANSDKHKSHPILNAIAFTEIISIAAKYFKKDKNT
ncbi:MAG: hypothetical protein RR573_02170 [Oscillospiraceae bacterium]